MWESPWIEKSEFIGDISPKYRISVAPISISRNIVKKSANWRRISKNRQTYRRYFGIFIGKFPDISYQFSPRIGYKICPFFLKKRHKMLFGNLIMICRQRFCFSAWLKNRAFRVREI